MLSDRGNLLRGVPLAAALSPVGVALPPTLPVAAAAALLPPQSAAMAAYLNAAAAAAQHSHRMMMTSPLPAAYNRSSVSPLISSTSPTGLVMNTPGVPAASPDGSIQSPLAEGGVLDFSKRSESKSEMSDSDGDAINLAKPSTPTSGEASPLDLSFTSRKRSSEESSGPQPPRKQKTDFKPQVLPQWPSPVTASHLPYFAAAVAAANSISPKANSNPELWNGKLKHVAPAPSDATKALEKMSELSKLGGEELFRTMAGTGTPINSTSSRHSAWQSHWLNKGAEQAKDVLKCVWCKQSFPSLAAMTTHMKEAKHCGVNVPVPSMQPQSLPPQPQISSPSNTNTSSSSTNSKSDLNLLIKETMPLPRKLVRGQDVWLGKGAEQTRQILKCMWCGQSFRSLAEMTNHMQQTQHYTNIISQEQIISWRSSDDSKNGGGGGGGGNAPVPGGASSHVSAVLTCKVCDQAFSSLKELSNHMVKNSHYKEHIMRSITESGGRRRQTREKRKKSLPVRKLLELERAQHEFKNGENGSITDKMRDAAGVGRITCEKCGNKIETSLFVDHIRQCVGGGSIGSSQRNFLKNALMSSNILPPDTHKLKPSNNNKSPSPVSQLRSPSATDLSTKESQGSDNNNGSSPSVLNAIEKLIEKSFDSRTRQNSAFPGHGAPSAPMGSSILKRLGIDESVDYTKPLVDAQTMNLLRNYHQQQAHHYARRERSGSESSSFSERGSSRADALTPEKKIEPTGVPFPSNTPRSTPDKQDKSPVNEKDGEVIVKREVEETMENHSSVRVKKETEEDNDDDEDRSVRSSAATPHVKEEEDDEKRNSPVHGSREHTPATETHATSPCRNSTCSPASSDRSGTPRSSNGDRKSGGSLGALSSMFDNLSGGGVSSENPSSSGKKGSSHPLAALQKLCDKTETHTNNRSHSNSASAGNSNAGTPNSNATTPGAILAFSWACNDAVVTPDSIMKCAFCDTPFISKGAYRHHLSKMHFVKDGVIPDPVALKSSQPSSSGSLPVPVKSGTSGGNKSPPTSGSFEESPHSKFLKYTELAKQLSSKYV